MWLPVLGEFTDILKWNHKWDDALSMWLKSKVKMQNEELLINSCSVTRKGHKTGFLFAPSKKTSNASLKSSTSVFQQMFLFIYLVIYLFPSILITKPQTFRVKFAQAITHSISTHFCKNKVYFFMSDIRICNKCKICCRTIGVRNAFWTWILWFLEELVTFKPVFSQSRSAFVLPAALVLH